MESNICTSMYYSIIFGVTTKGCYLSAGEGET